MEFLSKHLMQRIYNMNENMNEPNILPNFLPSNRLMTPARPSLAGCGKTHSDLYNRH